MRPLCNLLLIRPELGFLEELDDAFLVFLPGIPFAHGPSMPSPLPRGVLVFVIRAIARRAFFPVAWESLPKFTRLGAVYVLLV